MNVVLVSFEFPPANNIGGIGSYMHHLSVFLSGKGFHVTVFSANPLASQLSIVQLPHCVNYLIPSLNNDLFIEDVLKVFEDFIKTNKVDCIESAEVGANALLIKEAYPSIPLIVKMHTAGVLITKVNNTYVPLKTKLRFVAGALLRGRIDGGYWAKHDKNKEHDLEYKICMKADTLLSPSLALKNWAVNFWGIKSQAIKVLRNPFSVQDELFGMPIPGRADVISFVGKLSVLKGMKVLTKAIPLILKKNKGYTIILVGRDEIENGKSMQQFMETELAAYKSQIIFSGALNKEKLNEVYASSKLCMFPSLWENYPNVIMEAMAAGAAVVAADRGGIPELVTNNSTGMLFDALSSQQLAAAVNELLEDDTKRIKLATTARDELIDKINDEQYEKDLLSVYTQYQNKETIV